ncbi:hypothetical protein FA09DRAFT_325320 [Tilletiopsis washingtonensis]|uniref:Uncharacterized protein n=1 Tax=Tilletiopsis washingtonensis TaxID=58919 RepID=A0A316Z9Q4_9BASI|nr:hypothetical protein FA09DRAFT_325320 [Tilletiopsis washingtonensis]PWN98527.1 hypothetical protein FA09DRAFT_325320 [Tilletiopsis washingtonensis]
MKKRLRNVVRLALGEAVAQRKSGKLTDVDVLWHAVERELREASESQPLAPLARALTEVRRSARILFTALSQRASERATLLLHLAAARKRKRTLRTQVWEQRMELLRLQREAEELEKAEKERKEKVETNTKLEGFLQQLSSASVAWR